MSIGIRIKEARIRKKLTQAELAKRAGVDQSTVSDLERGKTSATTSIAMLANALEVSPLWLETGKGLKNQEAGISVDNAALIVISEQEKELINAYRAMREEDRFHISSIATTLALSATQSADTIRTGTDN